MNSASYSPSQPALARHVKSSPAIAAAATKYFMSFYQFVCAKYSSQQQECPNPIVHISAVAGSHPCSSNPSRNPSCSTSEPVLVAVPPPCLRVVGNTAVLVVVPPPYLKVKLAAAAASDTTCLAKSLNYVKV